MTRVPMLVQEIRYERDIASLRRLARDIATRLGFDSQDRVRIATAVSEMARIIFVFVGRGKAEFLVEEHALVQHFVLQFTGPDPAKLQQLGEPAELPAELKQGVDNARRLMDRFGVETLPDGRLSVVLGKSLPRNLDEQALSAIVREMAELPPDDPFEEIRRQNQELAELLQQLRERQEQLTRINRELEDRNRGVTSLYAVLEEQTEQLQDANRLKSRFISQMSHEFRTPLSSIIALTRLLLGRLDGDLTPEQDHQVTLIQQSAQELLDMIGDLLDLAKIEAGKLSVEPTQFTLSELFSSLRGMFKPLHSNPDVALIFEEPLHFPVFRTDERKVAQILRNFISNALKFTERGEVRVVADLADGGQVAIFSVSDTGIGISPEDQQRIFKDFEQVKTHLHKVHKGTGLGLALSKQLTEVLGGTLTLESEPGKGSTFSAIIPLTYPGIAEDMPEVVQEQLGQEGAAVLVIEDDPEDLALYEEYLKDSPFRVIPVQTLAGAWEILKHLRPAAIVLDILLANESGWDFLTELRSNEATRDIPVIVATVVSGEQEMGFVLGADEYMLKPIVQDTLVERLDALSHGETIMIIDDDSAWRYTFRKTLEGTPYQIIEAASGPEGLRLAAQKAPGLIFLDLVMPEMSGFEVLEKLKSDPATRSIPVVAYSSKRLYDADRERLMQQTVAVVSKDTTSREMILARIKDTLIQSGSAG